jgi:xanthine dehydrogenase molybdopterin-binding subunit B
MNPEKDNIGNYSIWGVGVTEVEVDILTGETRLVRVDLLEDVGLSTSPQVSIEISC